MGWETRVTPFRVIDFLDFFYGTDSANPIFINSFVGTQYENRMNQSAEQKLIKEKFPLAFITEMHTFAIDAKTNFANIFLQNKIAKMYCGKS